MYSLSPCPHNVKYISFVCPGDLFNQPRHLTLHFSYCTSCNCCDLQYLQRSSRLCACRVCQTNTIHSLCPGIVSSSFIRLPHKHPLTGIKQPAQEEESRDLPAGQTIFLMHKVQLHIESFSLKSHSCRSF